jgi:hypothetical protein
VRAPPVVVLLVLCAATLGCETLAAGDRVLYDVVPLHPVTGEPVPNLIPAAQEIEHAQRQHEEIVAQSVREGVAFDPAGPRLDQIRRVFARLLAVAHRQELPWSAHLLVKPDVNAYTIGGGRVYVYEGLFGPAGLVRDGDDDELAAVLAHEIAHVTLLHVSLQETWLLIVERARIDPFYAASFTTAQEADADKLSVLYMALAGFDPHAAERVWRRAHQREGSDPAQQAFQHNHPLNAERVGITHSAAEQVAQYYTAGRQNDGWAAIFVDNPLFPRAEEQAYQPGGGLLRAIDVASEGVTQHYETRTEALKRETALAQDAQAQMRLVRALSTRAGYDGYGRPALQVLVQNGSRHPTQAIRLQLTYFAGAQPLAQDPSCAGPAPIAPGGSAWLACPAQQVPGATAVGATVAEVGFAP